MKKYKVWDCQLVVAGDAKLPDGFDWPPRAAVLSAMEAEGVKVLACFSGWGGRLTAARQRRMERTPVRKTKKETT